MKRAKVLAVVGGSFAMLGLLLSPVPVLATSILDFTLTAPTGGTISYGGGSASLVGVGIAVDSVVGIGTPSSNGVSHACLGCTLAFTTGSSTGAWTWGNAGGSSITLIGTVDLNNNNVADDAATGTLLSGSFGSATVVPIGTGVFKIAGAEFSDTKNAALAAHYGLPVGPYSGTFNLGFNASASIGSPFSSTAVLSGNVSNSIPEASSLLLLGAGLLGLAFWGRKKINGVN